MPSRVRDAQTGNNEFWNDMVCDVFNAFRYATEDLSPTIHQQAMYKSMWMNLIRRSTCKLNAGTRFVNFGFGNTEPLLTVGKWKTIALSRDRAGCQQTGTVQDEDNFSTNQWQEVQFGETELDYQPEYWQMKGPLVTRQQLMFSHNIDKFMEGYVMRVSDRAQREWEMNYHFNYLRFCRQASACAHFPNSYNGASNVTITESGGTGLPDDPLYTQTLDIGITTPLKQPKGLLTQQMLELVSDYLMDQGATNPDEHGFISWEDAGPIFSLYIPSMLSQNILRLNNDLRQDYRYGDPQTLIARLGARRVVGNWRHWINQKEDRWAFTANGGGPDADGDLVGSFRLIQPFVDSADANAYGTPIATRGKYASANKAWRDATIGSVIVLSPDVYESEIIPDKRSAGSVAFGGQDWGGHMEFVTGAYKFESAQADCVNDPLQDKGRHFATFGHAPSPNPMGVFNYGWIIFYDRSALVGNAATTVTTLS